MSDVNIYIDELVIENVDGVDREALTQALQEEVARLVSERGIPAAWQQDRNLQHVDAGRVGTTGGSSQLGRNIARAVVAGIAGRATS